MNDRAAAPRQIGFCSRPAAAALIRQDYRRSETARCDRQIQNRGLSQPSRRGALGLHFGGPWFRPSLAFRPPAPNAVKTVSRLLHFLELGGERVAHEAIPAVLLQTRLFVPFRFAAAYDQGVAGARQRHVEKAAMFFLVRAAYRLPGRGEGL